MEAWRTGIVQADAETIRIRGYDITALMRSASFAFLHCMELAAVAFLFARLAPSQALHVGQLLIARAQVPDGRFRHAVVLLVGEGSQGFAGLVLNEPTATPVDRLFPGVASAQERNDVAFTGGPVDSARLFCLLHTKGPLREASLVLPGIYASTSLDLMHLALNARLPAISFRVFQGYAGWKPGQLQREIAAGLWTLRPGSAALIFDPDPATLWARLNRPAAPAPHLLLTAHRKSAKLLYGRPIWRRFRTARWRSWSWPRWRPWAPCTATAWRGGLSRSVAPSS